LIVSGQAAAPVVLVTPVQDCVPTENTIGSLPIPTDVPLKVSTAERTTVSWKKPDVAPVYAVAVVVEATSEA